MFPRINLSGGYSTSGCTRRQNNTKNNTNKAAQGKGKEKQQQVSTSQPLKISGSQQTGKQPPLPPLRQAPYLGYLSNSTVKSYSGNPFINPFLQKSDNLPGGSHSRNPFSNQSFQNLNNSIGHGSLSAIPENQMSRAGTSSHPDRITKKGADGASSSTNTTSQLNQKPNYPYYPYYYYYPYYNNSNSTNSNSDYSNSNISNSDYYNSSYNYSDPNYNYSNGNFADSIRIVPNNRGEGGCVVAALAMATGKSYTEARHYAAQEGFSGNGIYLKDAIHALKNLGGDGEYYAHQPDTWSQFPDAVAIIEVHAGDGNHAVVLRGPNIFDGNHNASMPREYYSLMTDGSCIVLNNK